MTTLQLAAGVLAAVLTAGAAVLLLIHARRARRATRRALASVATFHGLKHEGGAVLGAIDGFGVVLAHERRRSKGGGPSDSEPCTTLTVSWEIPMDLGLNLQAKHFGAQASADWLFQALNGLLRDDKSDVGPRHWMFATEPSRLGPLHNPALIETLHSLGQFSLNDHCLRIEQYGHVADVAYLASAIDRSLTVARMVRAARGYIGLAAPLVPLEPMFASFAAEHGLSMTRCPLTIWGRIGECETVSRARRNGPEYDMIVDVYFPSPLGVGLTIGRERWRDRLPFSGPHETDVSDRAFDDTFRVTSGNDALTSRSLDAPLRDVLRQLNHHYPLHVSDDRVSVTVPMHVLDHVPSVVPEVQRVAAHLHGRFSGRTPAGARIASLRLPPLRSRPVATRRSDPSWSAAATAKWVLALMGVVAALVGIGLIARAAWYEPHVALVTRYVDAINAGRFDDARATLLHPDSMPRAEFLRGAHASVFRRTRTFEVESSSRDAFDTLISVRADGSLVCFALFEQRDGDWKIRSARPGACP